MGRISGDDGDNMCVAERQRNYARRKRDAGLVRVAVWVPCEGKQALREFAKGLRETAGHSMRESGRFGDGHEWRLPNTRLEDI